MTREVELVAPSQVSMPLQTIDEALREWARPPEHDPWDPDVLALWAKAMNVEYGSSEAVPSEAKAVLAQAKMVRAAPGHFFVRLSALLPRRGPVRKIIEQSVADMREEHVEALIAQDQQLAHWIVVRGNVSTLWAVLTYLGFWAIVGRAMKMWKGE